MKTINEIFETNPELLKTKEVIELVEQFMFQFNCIKNKYFNYWGKITDLTINSELFVINGTIAKEVIEEINNLSFNDDYTLNI